MVERAAKFLQIRLDIGEDFAPLRCGVPDCAAAGQAIERAVEAAYAGRGIGDSDGTVAITRAVIAELG